MEHASLQIFSSKYENYEFKSHEVHSLILLLQVSQWALGEHAVQVNVNSLILYPIKYKFIKFNF